jgi:XTP/dITP diphosphohydrolase
MAPAPEPALPPQPAAASAASGPRLLLATTSQKKLIELRSIFAGLPLTLITLREAGVDMDVEETGETFRDNAVLKAEQYARATGLPSLADDSGLEIDALGGEPGVRSARYAGPDATDADRIALVLSKLSAGRDLPPARRTARFRCVMALAEPQGLIDTVDGACEGLIADAPRGSNGFGYDPIFLLPELGRTMAELSAAEKDALSHRGRAGRAARPLLVRRLLESAPLPRP